MNLDVLDEFNQTKILRVKKVYIRTASLTQM
jgi:hypothetical protein